MFRLKIQILSPGYPFNPMKSWQWRLRNQVACYFSIHEKHRTFFHSWIKPCLYNQWKLQQLCQFGTLLIGISSMQGWAATTRLGVTRKRSTKGLKHKGYLFKKDLHLKYISYYKERTVKRYLLILDLIYLDYRSRESIL